MSARFASRSDLQTSDAALPNHPASTKQRIAVDDQVHRVRLESVSKFLVITRISDMHRIELDLRWEQPNASRTDIGSGSRRGFQPANRDVAGHRAEAPEQQHQDGRDNDKPCQ